jgi:hypothetical protein
MKKFFSIITFLFSVSAFAQSSDGVINALKEGSANKFSSYFKGNIDLKLPQDKDERKNVAKQDASSAVEGFFSSNGINGFDLTSQRELNGTMYITGKLKGSSNSFGLTVMMETKGNEMSIVTVRIK